VKSPFLKIALLIGASLLLGVQAPSVDAFAEEVGAATGPVLESLDGTSSIQVNGEDGSVRSVSAGGEFHEGDWWEMPSGSVGRFIFKQGSQALLTGGTRVETREVFLDQTGSKIPSLIIVRGEVRALVDPATPEELAQAAPGAKKPLRFLIRTKTAVMGVRGTDFIVEADEAHSTVHTMSGTVDVGRDDFEVKSGKAQPVAASQFAESQEGHGVSAPKPFEPASFLHQFHQKHPRMENAFKRAAVDYHTGTLRQRFEDIRRHRVPTHATRYPARSRPDARAARKKPKPHSKPRKKRR
jgi:hypothetical protein